MAKNREGRGDGEAVLLLNKGKRGLLRMVFGRTMVIILLLALQVALLAAAFLRLGEYYYSFAALAAVAVSLTVVNRRRQNPAMKITWILLIMAAPVFAIPLYFFVDAELGHRMAHYRLETILEQTRKYAPPQPELRAKLAERDPGAASLAAYVEHTAHQRLYDASGVRFFPSGEETFQAMLEELEKAEKFIFLEFFIIEEGYMWGRILSVLQRKVKEGVEVRVLYDGTCAVGKVPYQYARQLEALGIQCRMFAPLRPFVSTHYNNRDHRKILVVDGRVAFTGGVNLADEYINRKVVYGHWKDTAIMISGRAVQGFTLMFLQMWNVQSGREEDYPRYLEAGGPVESDGFVLPYGDQPMDQENVAESVYLDILNRATRYVHIATPYLILDNEMMTALTYAAKRGVEVRLIVPGVPDKKTVFALTRSYYRELIEAGVEIYEYTPGFVHAKMFVSDDRTAVVGSINLDYRSLYLHFECAALLLGCAAVTEVEADMQRTFAQCRRLTVADCKKDRLSRRLTGWLLRPLAPLM